MPDVTRLNEVKVAGSIFDRRCMISIPNRRSHEHDAIRNPPASGSLLVAELKLPASINASFGFYGVAVRSEALIYGGGAPTISTVSLAPGRISILTGQKNQRQIIIMQAGQAQEDIHGI